MQGMWVQSLVGELSAGKLILHLHFLNLTTQELMGHGEKPLHLSVEPERHNEDPAQPKLNA